MPGKRSKERRPEEGRGDGPRANGKPAAHGKATAVPRPVDVKEAYHQEMGPGRRSVMWSWLSFTVTFGVVRAITYSIRDKVGPFHNLTTKRGMHLHHYLWGIGLVSAVGAVAVRGDREAAAHPLLGVAYGTGMALIVDEFALLLDLKDVYWAKEGRWSVDIGIGLIAVSGSALASGPLLARLHRDRRAASGRA